MGVILNTVPTFHPLPNVEHKRLYRYPWQMEAIREELILSGKTFIDGIHSLYIYSDRVKYINLDACDKWPDLNNNFIPMLAGEIARTELEREFGKPYIPVRKEELNLLDVPPPNYYTGEEYHGQLFYLDLSGAYNQIYEFLTLDCAFPGGEGELWLTGPAQRLRTNKLARNALVGITRAHTVPLWKDGEEKDNPFHNTYFNPNLWAQIQAILHELATIAINEECFYVATDGYLFKDKEGFETFKEVLDNSGMKYKVLSGKGRVTGWCSYSLPGKSTKINRSDTGSLDNILNERGHLNWLKKVKKSRQSL